VSDSTAFREIDEAVRKDQLKEWWVRWGTWFVGGAVLFVVLVSAGVGWRQYDASRRAVAGQAYSAALAKIGQDRAAARTELEAQANNAPEPYRSLARLVAAQLRDTPADQAAALASVAATLSSPELADLARIIAATKSIDAGKADEYMAALEPLAGPDKPFRASVRELQALVASQKGDLKRARELWTEITRDSSAPQGMAQRAQAMLSLNGAGEAK
jgi:hypothetical protein